MLLFLVQNGVLPAFGDPHRRTTSHLAEQAVHSQDFIHAGVVRTEAVTVVGK